jgi:hypothetical protein
MANVLEATIEAVKSSSDDLADAARHTAGALGDQFSALAARVSDLIEPEPKRSSKRWLWALFLVAAVGVAVMWWRRTPRNSAGEAGVDRDDTRRVPMDARAVS